MACNRVWSQHSCFHLTLAPYLDAEAFFAATQLCRGAFVMRHFGDVPNVYVWTNNSAQPPLTRVDWDPFRLDMHASVTKTFNLCPKDRVHWYSPVVYHIEHSFCWFFHTLDFEWLLDADNDSLGTNVSFGVLDNTEDLLNVLDLVLTYQFEMDREDKDITIDFAEYHGNAKVNAVAQILEDKIWEIGLHRSSPSYHNVSLKISMRKRIWYDFDYDAVRGMADWGITDEVSQIVDDRTLLADL